MQQASDGRRDVDLRVVRRLGEPLLVKVCPGGRTLLHRLELRRDSIHTGTTHSSADGHGTRHTGLVKNVWYALCLSLAGEPVGFFLNVVAVCASSARKLRHAMQPLQPSQIGENKMDFQRSRLSVRWGESPLVIGSGYTEAGIVARCFDCKRETVPQL